MHGAGIKIKCRPVPCQVLHKGTSYVEGIILALKGQSVVHSFTSMGDGRWDRYCRPLAIDLESITVLCSVDRLWVRCQRVWFSAASSGNRCHHSFMKLIRLVNYLKIIIFKIYKVGTCIELHNTVGLITEIKGIQQRSRGSIPGRS